MSNRVYLSPAERTQLSGGLPVVTAAATQLQRGTQVLSAVRYDRCGYQSPDKLVVASTPRPASTVGTKRPSLEERGRSASVPGIIDGVWPVSRWLEAGVDARGLPSSSSLEKKFRRHQSTSGMSLEELGRNFSAPDDEPSYASPSSSRLPPISSATVTPPRRHFRPGAALLENGVARLTLEVQIPDRNFFHPDSVRQCPAPRSWRKAVHTSWWRKPPPPAQPPAPPPPHPASASLLVAPIGWSKNGPMGEVSIEATLNDAIGNLCWASDEAGATGAVSWRAEKEDWGCKLNLPSGARAGVVATRDRPAAAGDIMMS